MSGNLINQARIENIFWKGEPAARIGAGGYEALLVPGIGAQVIEFKDLQRGLDLLREPVAVDLEAFKARPQVFGIPILFPPNRIEDGKLEVVGETIDLPINDLKGHNHLHGFLRTRAWRITKMEACGETAAIEAVFSGDAASDSYGEYLNQFQFKLQYILSSAGLRQVLSIGNQSARPLPMGVGFHTAFRVPFHPEGKAEDYRLRVSVGEEWELNERLLPTGKLLPLSRHAQAYRTEGVTPQGVALSEHFKAKEIISDGRLFHGAILEDQSKRVRLIYQVEKAYKHWMIWNDTGTLGYICIEPQTWMTNAPKVDLPPEVTGYQVLQPGEHWTAESSIFIEEF